MRWPSPPLHHKRTQQHVHPPSHLVPGKRGIVRKREFVMRRVRTCGGGINPSSVPPFLFLLCCVLHPAIMGTNSFIPAGIVDFIPAGRTGTLASSLFFLFIYLLFYFLLCPFIECVKKNTPQRTHADTATRVVAFITIPHTFVHTRTHHHLDHFQSIDSEDTRVMMVSTRGL